MSEGVKILQKFCSAAFLDRFDKVRFEPNECCLSRKKSSAGRVLLKPEQKPEKHMALSRLVDALNLEVPSERLLQQAALFALVQPRGPPQAQGAQGAQGAPAQPTAGHVAGQAVQPAADAGGHAGN